MFLMVCAYDIEVRLYPQCIFKKIWQEKNIAKANNPVRIFKRPNLTTLSYFPDYTSTKFVLSF